MLAAPYFLGGAMLYILAIIVLLAVFGGTDEPRPLPEEQERLSAALARTTAYWADIFRY
jgi:hypothetical protein